LSIGTQRWALGVVDIQGIVDVFIAIVTAIRKIVDVSDIAWFIRILVLVLLVIDETHNRQNQQEQTQYNDDPNESLAIVGWCGRRWCRWGGRRRRRRRTIWHGDVSDVRICNRIIAQVNLSCLHQVRCIRVVIHKPNVELLEELIT